MIFLLIALQAADGALTWYAVANGLAKEGNGLLARLMARIGVAPALLLAKGAAAGCGVYLALTAPVAAWVLIALYATVVAWNVRIIAGALK